MLSLAAAACSGPVATTSTSSSSGSVTTDAGPPDAGSRTVCSSPTEVKCQDQLIQQLNLKTAVAPGLIDNTADGLGYKTHVDATAGGFMAANPSGYVYASFTDSGLVKKDLDDSHALSSMDWDIALRRYVLRINSGGSGPSCVQVARMPSSTNFDTLTSVPADIPWRTDDIMTPSCELIADGSGLPSSPNTALASYYSYPGCLKMTGNVFVLRRQDGRKIKLMITAYYNEDVQATCQTNGMINSMAPTGSGNVRIKWAFMDAP